MAERGIFAELLSKLRADAGMTQQELSDRSGVASSTIRNYEQGWREPNWESLVKLARGLGVGLEAFDPENVARPPLGTPQVPESKKAPPKKAKEAASPVGTKDRAVKTGDSVAKKHWYDLFRRGNSVTAD